MSAGMVFFLAAALFIIPCVFAGQSEADGAANIASFVGNWTGQYQECGSPAACQGRRVDMTITTETISFTLGPGEGGFARHAKGSSGPRFKSFPAKFENVKGVTTLSFTTSSGTLISFTLIGDKLEGQGSGGRFGETFTLTRTR